MHIKLPLRWSVSLLIYKKFHISKSMIKYNFDFKIQYMSNNSIVGGTKKYKIQNKIYKNNKTNILIHTPLASITCQFANTLEGLYFSVKYLHVLDLSPMTLNDLI
jgi:hypothetical protein